MLDVGLRSDGRRGRGGSGIGARNGQCGSRSGRENRKQLHRFSLLLAGKIPTGAETGTIVSVPCAILKQDGLRRAECLAHCWSV
jgi:hypothetical protein